MEKLYSVMRPPARSSYIFMNRLSISALRLSALRSSAACFFLLCCSGLIAGSHQFFQHLLSIGVHPLRPVLQSHQYEAVQHIVVDGVCRAFMQTFAVLAASEPALSVLPRVIAVGQRPSAVSTFDESCKDLDGSILPSTSPAADCSCTCQKTPSGIMASWVCSARNHSSLGLYTLFLLLKDTVPHLLCTLLPMYTSLVSIFLCSASPRCTVFLPAHWQRHGHRFHGVDSSASWGKESSLCTVAV